MKILESLKSAVANAIAHPKTTATGFTAIIGGVQMVRHGNVEAGLVAIVTGLGLVLAKDN